MRSSVYCTDRRPANKGFGSMAVSTSRMAGSLVDDGKSVRPSGACRPVHRSFGDDRVQDDLLDEILIGEVSDIYLSVLHVQ